MYCPFCGSSVTASHGFCGVCGRDITFLKDVANKVPEEMPTTSAHLSAQPSTSAGSSAVESFHKYREIKKRERKTFFTKGRHNSKNEKKQKIVKVCNVFYYEYICNSHLVTTLSYDVQRLYYFCWSNEDDGWLP
ncbi:hypothetical protein F7725_025642 [Dissostichus mawsoni]|uniref:Uncharacterized protein n=1 Tax=Dissostichus mawsoni TaxID=36200 RepID=A0A7J5XDT3_DISMA|nr:hypothetical protein F7725_025642 [Dissostichus mawsoni]